MTTAIAPAPPELNVPFDLFVRIADAADAAITDGGSAELVDLDRILHLCADRARKVAAGRFLGPDGVVPVPADWLDTITHYAARQFIENPGAATAAQQAVDIAAVLRLLADHAPEWLTHVTPQLVRNVTQKENDR